MSLDKVKVISPETRRLAALADDMEPEPYFGGLNHASCCTCSHCQPRHCSDLKPHGGEPE